MPQAPSVSGAKRGRRTRAAEPELLAEQLIGGDRPALARAITLIESTRAQDRAPAERLLDRLLPLSGGAMRLGVSGAPGVGKSTFIEALGVHAIGRGHRVAVLAVDPSSKRSGGSILGDKTRMPELSVSRQAFIRPSPTGGGLGGVARRTREAMLACEAAGFDVVMVETVGVGQSETAVADLVDMFVLLLMPAAGDELQGLKKGIIELADLLVVTKADGALTQAAGRTEAEFASALNLLRPASPGWRPRTLQCSALDGTGIEEVWQQIGAYRAAMTVSGGLVDRRRGQARAWMWNEIDQGLTAALAADPKAARLMPELEAKVSAGGITPTVAARALLQAFLGRRRGKAP